MSDFASGCMFMIFLLLVVAVPVIAVLIARPNILYKIIFRKTGEYMHKSTIVEARGVAAAIRKLHTRVSYVAEIYSIEEYTLGHG